MDIREKYEHVADIFEVRLSGVDWKTCFELAMELVDSLPKAVLAEEVEMMWGSFVDEKIPRWRRLLFGAGYLHCTHSVGLTSQCLEKFRGYLREHNSHVGADSTMLLTFLVVRVCIETKSVDGVAAVVDFISDCIDSLKIFPQEPPGAEAALLAAVFGQDQACLESLVGSRLVEVICTQYLQVLECLLKQNNTDTLAKQLLLPLQSFLELTGTMAVVCPAAWTLVVEACELEAPQLSAGAQSSSKLLLATTICCHLVNGDGAQDIINGRGFYLFVLRSFLHDDAVVRKRAAYLLQSALNRIADTNERVSWMRDYLDVYAQVESCHALHLVVQVTDRMRRLCKLACENSVPYSWDETNDSFHAVDLNKSTNLRAAVYLVDSCNSTEKIPLPTFHWVKALIHIILRCQMPNIRKEIVYKVFEGEVMLNFCDESVLEWISEELIPAIDHVVFFPSTLFFGKRWDVGARNALNRSSPTYFLGGNVYHRSPGALFPFFLSKVLQSTSDHRREKLLRSLVRGIITSRIRTLSSIKWIFRLFYEDCMKDLISPNCFDSEMLKGVQKFYQRHLVSANMVLRDYIVTGLYSLLFQGTVSKSAGVDILQLVYSTTSMKTLSNSLHLFPIFLEAMGRAGGAAPSGCSELLISEAMVYRTIATAGAQQGLYEKVAKITQFSSDDFSANPIVFKELTLVLMGIFEAVQNIKYRWNAPVAEIKEVFQNIGDNSFVILEVFSSYMEQKFSKSSPIQLELDMHVASLLTMLPHVGPFLDKTSSLKSFESLSSILSSLNTILRSDLITENVFFILWCLKICKVITFRLENRMFCHVDYPSKVHEILVKLVFTLLKLQVPTPMRFHACQKEEKKNYYDLDQYGMYGSYCNAFTECRWGSLEAALRILHQQEKSPELGLTTISLDIFDQIRGELDVSTKDTLPVLLHCSASLARTAFDGDPANEMSGDLSILQLKLADIINAGWDLSRSEANISLSGVEAVVHLAFDSVLMQFMDTSFTRFIFAKMYKLAIEGRGHLLQMVCLQLTSVWTTTLKIDEEFIPDIVDLLLFKEGPRDDNSCVNIDAIQSDTVVRFVVLEALELLQKGRSNKNRQFLQKLIFALIQKSTNKKYAASAMIGTELFGEKLRIWQALCILSDSVNEEIAPSIISQYFAALHQTCSHGIRTCLEIFGAKLATMFPSIVLPRVLQTLRSFNIPQQVLASQFIILGHCFNQDPCPFARDSEALNEIVKCVLPWLVVSSGLPRTLAIHLLHQLIPYIDKTPITRDGGRMNEIDFFEVINNHIIQNKDTKKLLLRASTFYEDYNLKSKCTLMGIRDIGVNHAGEIIPDHLLHIMAEVFRSNISDSEKEQSSSLGSSLSNNDKSDDSLEGGKHPGVSAALQTKILPFDELQLAVSYHSRNTARRNRHSVIVCASLLSNEINIAGIARTSEIFAVEELVVPDMAITKSEAFLGITVSAEEWLHISECRPENLVEYLRRKRREGYDVVALEQTDSSVTLGDPSVALPRKAVLVLGKEKEGVSVEVLQMCTQTVEIQQFGVIRSLNVHVAASIVLYEMTKSCK